MTRRTKFFIGGAAVVILLGGAGYGLSRRDRDVTAVTFGKVERMDLTSKVNCNGNIDAKRKVDLSANIMGQIVNLAVREGEVVKKGDFLLQIDQKQFAAGAQGAAASLQALFSDRDATRANAADAQRTYNRALKNYNDKIVPLADLEKAKAVLDAANANVASFDQRIESQRANLAAAADTLSKTTMKAPMAGIVTALPVHEGEVAVIGTMNNPGTKLLTIADMSVVEAVMDVDETDIPNVKVGQHANVTIDAYPNKKFAGVVTEVGSSPITQQQLQGQSQAVNFQVKVQLENPPAGVRPGFSCSADIITGTRQKALAIPIQALVVREKPAKTAGKPQDEEGVFAVSADHTVKFVPVTTGLSGDNSIELVSGVKDGQQIVTGPFRALREIKDGSRVKEQKQEKKS